MPDSTLAERILTLHEYSGIKSRERLSKVCGLSPSHLALIVNGHIKGVRLEVAERICAAAGCSLAWLMFGGKPSPSRKSVHDHLAKAGKALDDAESRKGDRPDPKAA